MKRIFILITGLVLIQGCQSGPSDAALAKLKADTIKNMVFVKGGSFMMGDKPRKMFDPRTQKYFTGYYDTSTDSKPQHKVTLDSYSISKYEVTWAEYDLFTIAKGRKKFDFDESKKVRNKFRQQSQAAGVRTWNDAKEYCQWLGKITNLPIDLPTEAQWEYAARSRGQDVKYATDNGKYNPGRNIRKPRENIYPVGSFPPNPIGLYDMSSNASEWVNDWYSTNYYSKSPQNNPTGPSKGKRKVKRGGGIGDSTELSSTVVNRASHPVNSSHIGLRCVINSQNKTSF